MAERKPDTAIKTLREVVGRPGILIDRAQFAEDLANLRVEYKSDARFAAAVEAIARAITMAHTRRETFGTKLAHQLNSYYRAKFQSERKQGSPADLRLVFRPVPSSSDVEIVAFGNRFDPDSIYRTAQFRAAQLMINKDSVEDLAAPNKKSAKVERQRRKP